MPNFSVDNFFVNTDDLSLYIVLTGSCVCEMGFGGGDCGIDLSIPPIIYGIVDSGLCDLELLSCTSANLEGDGFTSEGNPTCRMRTFHVLKSYQVSFYVL